MECSLIQLWRQRCTILHVATGWVHVEKKKKKKRRSGNGELGVVGECGEEKEKEKEKKRNKKKWSNRLL